MADRTGPKGKGVKDMARKTGSKGKGGAGLDALVYGLIAAAAERDLGAVYGAAPATAIDELVAALRPAVEFVPPPSWRAFMAAFGSLRVLDAAGEVVDLCVYTPREAAAHTRERHVGPEVRWVDDDGSEHAITTDHLVRVRRRRRRRALVLRHPARPGPSTPYCIIRRSRCSPCKREGGGRVSAEAHEFADFTAWLRGEKVISAVHCGLRPAERTKSLR